MNKLNGIIKIILCLVLIMGLSSCSISGFDIDKDVYIYIDKSDDYDSVLKKIKKTAKPNSKFIFDTQVSFLGYKDLVKTGKYKVSPDMTSSELIRNLRAGNQNPHKITFNNLRLLSDLSTKISEQLMLSKIELEKLLNDSSVVTSYGFTKETFPAMFIPNTYEVYWDMTEKSFLDRMKKEFDAFWNSSRLEQAKSLGLDPIGVSTLAAIVEEECMFVDEYPVVAGLYLNRFKRGQLLQADPTVKFATGDFGLKRILHVHLRINSPYNTYIYKGLPPGPIRIPSIQGLNSVLNKANHNYLYMCAKEDFSGRHNFATTLAEHERNATRYRSELNRRKIQ